ncbi:hypothetical protein [Paenibacillus xylaniclasticus]|uniref:hypothetical protein n=1 Tax=Paenibacillus xylaniclasticus TaxID=588083 RepID=UPI000FD9EE13|nr:MULTISPECIES: hypothetical protein [Paenibacillus]
MNRRKLNDSGQLRVSPLLAMEMRTFTSFMPMSKFTAGIWASGILLLLIACRIGFGERYEPEQIYALGGIFVWITVYSISIIRVLSLPQNPFREWWLTMPLSRKALIRAHMLGSLPLSGCFSAALWLIATLHNTLSAGITDSPLYAGTDQIINAAISYAVFYAALTVLLTFVPMLMMTVMKGWRQSFLLLFFAMWILPTGSLGTFYITQPSSSWLDAEHVWLYTAVTLLLIPLVYSLCLHLIPKYGIDWTLSKLAILGSDRLQMSLHSSHAKMQRSSTSGFRSLYTLEKSFFRSLTSTWWFRTIYTFVLLLVALGAYFSLENDEWVEMLRAIILLPSIVTALSPFFRLTADISKRRLEWVLSSPYSRITIMLSRLVAAWTTSAIWVSGLAAGMALGAAARWLFDRPEQFGAEQAVLNAIYVIALYMVYVVSSSLVSMMPYAYDIRIWLGIASAPLLVIAYAGPMLFNQYVLPESLMMNEISRSNWIGLVLYALIALPLSWATFVAASKGLSTSMYITQDRQRKIGLRTRN